MSCILHTVGSRVSFPKDVNWINESTGAKGMVEKGKVAVIRSIDTKNHKLTIEVEGLTLTVDASMFESSKGHTHE